jgi:hypothetical protein
VKFLAIVAITLVLPSFAAELRIELRPRAEVAGGVILLGQLAKLESDDLQLLRTAADLPVGRLPQSGRRQRISAASLQAAVQHAVRARGGNARWTGSTACDIEAATVVVHGEAIARAALQLVGGELQTLRIPRDVRIPVGPVSLTARPPGRGLVAGRQLVLVDVHSGGEWVRSVAVSVRTPADGRPRLAPGEARADQARSDVLALHPGPVVGRGHSATLRSGRGDVLAETRVEVLQDGHDGDRVLVRTMTAPGPLSARVIGPDLLEIDR